MERDNPLKAQKKKRGAKQAKQKKQLEADRKERERIARIAAAEARARAAEGAGIRRIPIPSGDAVDGLAVLSNIYGIEAAADIIGIDTELADNAISGDYLDRYDSAAITSGYLRIANDEELQDLYNIDVNDLFDITDKVSYAFRGNNQTVVGMADKNNADIVREAIASGAIDLEKFAESSPLLAFELTTTQCSILLDEWAFQQQYGRPNRAHEMFDFNTMFDKYREDNGAINNVKNSLFWAWFRELFY